jgi:hypothetical protein
MNGKAQLILSVFLILVCVSSVAFARKAIDPASSNYLNISPNAGMSVSSGATACDVGGKIALSLHGRRQLLFGVKLMGEGLYWRHGALSNPAWAYKVEGFTRYNFRPGDRIQPGFSLGLSKNFGGDFNPFACKAGIDLTFFIADKWPVSLNTGYLYRGRFDYDTSDAVRRNVRGAGAYFISFSPFGM